MPLYGDLRTFSLESVLRWAATNQKTGVLEVERNAIAKRVEFRKGWVGSCSSNDPASLLGQFLLSRGRIDEIQLQHLLTLHQVTRKRLGLLLVEMNVVSRSELATEVAAKAQETIHSLFDWEDAHFRFDEGATLDPDRIEVNLSVDELIAEGKKRAAELRQIRNVFSSSGAVLVRTANDAPGELLDRPSVRRIFDAIDGRRTIAEILLYARLSEFRVLQLLYCLYGRGLLQIAEIRPVAPADKTILDVADLARQNDGPTPAPAGSAPQTGGLECAATDADIDAEIERALQLIEQLEFEGAVEVLRGVCRDQVNDFARRLLLKAETAFVSSVKEDDSFVTQIPVLMQDRHESLRQEMRPEESFLLTMIDGTTDVQSMLWLSPLREIDVLTALRRLAELGVIELRRAEELTSVPLQSPVVCAR